MPALRVVGILLGTGLIQAFLPRLWQPLGYVDLMMMAVVFYSLRLPFRRAVLVGAVAGLVEDALSGGIVGLHAFTKTLIASLVASVGNVLVLRGHFPWVVVVGVAEVAEGLVAVLLLGALGRGTTLDPTQTLVRALVTSGAAAAGILAIERFRLQRRRRRRS